MMADSESDETVIEKKPIVMTLLVRDEADIVGANIAYHLARGVSHIIATDNGSTDETREILKTYERLGLLTYILEEAYTHDQVTWVTRMAHEAHRQFPSSIVFHVDADEFWWPASGNLADTLHAAFCGFDGVCLVRRVNYVGPNIHRDSSAFLEHCRYRQVTPISVLGAPLPGKVCHVADPGVWIDHGNHRALFSDRKTPTREIESVEVLHFPNRSLDQFVAKIRRGIAAVRNNTGLPDSVCRTWRAMASALERDTFGIEFEDQIVTEADIRSRLANGDLEPCTKLREFLSAYVNQGSRTGPKAIQTHS